MPATCSICLEPFTSPVSLPCGHVFCGACIRRAVNSIPSYNIQHSCPTCRASYSVLTVDPIIIPPHLRPHILPSIRPVFIDTSPVPSGSSASQSGSPPVPVPVAAPVHVPPPAHARRAAAAEITALQMECAMWRKRAETHALANTNLVSLVRATKECALRLRAERDAERSRCVLLKRKLVELEPESDESPSKRMREDSSKTKETVAPPPLPRVGLPVFLMQCKAYAPQRTGAVASADKFKDQPSLLGAPITRRRSLADRSSTCPSVAKQEDTTSVAAVVRSGETETEPTASKASVQAVADRPESLPVSRLVLPVGAQ